MKTLSTILLFLAALFATSVHAQNLNPYQINWGTQGYPVVPNPTASQTIVQPSGTSLSVNAFNGSFVVGQAPYGNIQAAITAASATCATTQSTCASVVIPANYTGTDSWSANTTGVLVYDMRPLALGTVVGSVTVQTNTINTVNASLFGATCTGGHDDTAAINAALNAQWAYNLPLTTRKNVTVQLPQGSCLIQAPVELGPYASLVGHDSGTFVVCDYLAWRGTDYNCLEMVANGQISAGASIGPRRIGGFSLIGIGNSGIPNSTGISMVNHANVTSPSYTFINLSFDHLQISGFDTCIYAEDFSNSQINWAGCYQSRVGFNFNGNVVNIGINNSGIFDGSWDSTSTHTQTYGVIIQPNTKYATGGLTCNVNLYCGGQGIGFNGTSVLNYDTLVNQQQCIACSYMNAAFDQAGAGPVGSGYAFQLGPLAIGDGMVIYNNDIGTQNGADPLIYSTSNNSDLHIYHNSFFVDAGIPNTGTIGIVMAGSGTFSQLKVNDNSFNGMTAGLSLQQNVTYSTITGNSGSSISSKLIDLSGAASLVHTATILRDNTDSDNIPIINEGTATGWRTEWNQSPYGIIGTQVGAVAGCTFAAGAVGNNCSTTLSWPVAFHDNVYNISSCIVENGSGNNAITVNTLTYSGMTVEEVALSTTATGGGTIVCSANHP